MFGIIYVLYQAMELFYKIISILVYYMGKRQINKNNLKYYP